MSEICPSEMGAALARYIAFERVQVRVGNEELQRRLDTGHTPDDLLRGQFAEMDRDTMSDVLGELREAVGLSDGAMREFWRDLPQLLHTETDWALDHAAFVGLIVGLLARQELDA